MAGITARQKIDFRTDFTFHLLSIVFLPGWVRPRLVGRTTAL